MIAAERGYGEAGGFPHSSIVEECRVTQWDSLDIAKKKTRKQVRKALVRLMNRRQELMDSNCWHQPENFERVWVDHLLKQLGGMLSRVKKAS